MKKFLYIFLTFFITSSAFANQPVDWQLGFQKAASETMRDIVNFHDKLLLPIIFERTIVRKINKERLEKVIIEAAEQSNRITVPSIEDPQKLKSFLSSDMDLIFTDLNTVNTKIDLKKLTTKPTCVIIGPEGDFSEQERDEILKFNGVQPIKINENILRSETAVISALSIINYAIN